MSNFFEDPKATTAAAIAKAKPKKKPTSGGLDLGAPPPLPVTEKGPPSTSVALKAIYAKYPKWRTYQRPLYASAKKWGIDPADLLSLLAFENGNADPNPDNPLAYGLAQIADTSVDKSLNPDAYAAFVREHGKGTQPLNSVWAIDYAAWRLAGGLSHYPSLNDYYKGDNGDATAPRGYNPGFTSDSRGEGPEAIYRISGVTDYQPKRALTPREKANNSVTTSQVRASISNPYVSGVDKKRDPKTGAYLINTTSDPRKAMTYLGNPITRSDFLTERSNLERYFISYTGKRPNNRQVANVLTNGWGEYTLIDTLSHSPNFVNSPIYKKQSLAYQAASRDLLPSGAKLDRETLRLAIVNDWSEAALQEKLRESSTYEKSNEFLNNSAALTSSYKNIMGAPDAQATEVVKKATKLGWTQGIFESWLRGTPSYQYSPEYQAKTVTFLDAMGLFTGAKPTLDEASPKQLAKVPETQLGKGSISPSLDLLPAKMPTTQTIAKAPKPKSAAKKVTPAPNPKGKMVGKLYG